jgi:copper(I)-binding protein
MKYLGYAVCILGFGLIPTLACAGDYTAGPLKISQPWSRVVPNGSKVAAGYMTITNTGSEPDKFIGGTADIANKVEVHEMTMSNGVMKMRALGGGLTIKPGETVALKPNSLHLMFQNLKQAPKQGTPINGTLEFEKAGKVDVQFSVAPMGAESPSGKKNASADPKHAHH